MQASTPGSKDFFQLVQDEIWRQFAHRVIVNRKTLKKYGRNEDVDTTEEDITTLGGTEAYPTTNSITTLSSSNAGDSGSVIVEGVTLSGGVFTFTAFTETLNGQNNVTLSTALARCTRLRGTVAGSVYAHEGGATTGGVPNDLTTAHNVLVSGDNTSLRAATSVASTNYFIMTQYWASLGRASGSAVVDVRLKSRIVGSDFFTQEIRSASASKDVERSFKPFLIIPPNSDIVMTATSSANNVVVSAGFDGFFADIISS